MQKFTSLSMILFAFCWQACQSNTDTQKAVLNEDMQTFSNFDKVPVTHVDWQAKIDFNKKQIQGTAVWHFQNRNHESSICFDTYDLTITQVKIGGKTVPFSLTPFHSVYGSGLRIPIDGNDSVLSIEYSTGPKATALQWLQPSQTAGKQLPYLFTQCESIHARSLLPCQDVPAIRTTYTADVQVPSGMMAVMSAHNPTQKTANGKYHFDMEIPIPSYLIALAAGDIAYQAIDERSGVYTEPSQLANAANELSDIPRMMKAAETLGGPYKWGKYDVLIAPPSFPIGGMENPRLTFATPTILAGDKSLVSLIAHEMAHSWSGNLVTNATWNDLWLNEGYTTYFERRIMESISGKDYTDMLWELGYQDLQSDLHDMGIKNPDTRLRGELKGRYPEVAFTNIPYEKGAVFLRMLEEGTGRAAFDAYLSSYFQSNAFHPMTTQRCLAYMDSCLFKNNIDLKEKLHVQDWVYGTGLPDNCPHTLPARFAAVDSARTHFEADGLAAKLKTASWSTHEWLQFLRKLPHPLSVDKMKTLDETFHITGSGNCEIADEWFRLALISHYPSAYPAMEKFLCRVGRKKFLEPLYGEMMRTTEGQKLAQDVFVKAAPNYHPLTAQKMKELITVPAK